MHTLYLQSSLSANGAGSLRGQSLVKSLQDLSDELILKHIVLPDSFTNKITEPALKHDVLSVSVLDALDPDLIYIEGGLFANEDGLWKVPEKIIKERLQLGSIVVVADADCNNVREYKNFYKNVYQLTKASIHYKSKDPVYASDSHSCWRGTRQIICKQKNMIIADWLRPIYEGIPAILVGLPAHLRSWDSLLATGNKGTTGTLHLDRWVDEIECCPFASVAKVSNGYVVFIAGNVSDDCWLEGCEHNTKWLTNICNFLVDTARHDRDIRRSHLLSPHQLFLSHRSIDKDYVRIVAREIKRQGVGIWFDEEALIPSQSLVEEINSGLESMTHFVIFWSISCQNAPWVKKELHAAISKLISDSIPIIVIRLDDTSVPAIIADLYRIEAFGKDAIEVGRMLSRTVERLEKHSQKLRHQLDDQEGL